MVFPVIPYVSLDLLKVQLLYFKKNSFIIIYKIIVMKGRKHFHHDRHFVTTKGVLSAQDLMVSFCNLSSVLLEFPAETVLRSLDRKANRARSERGKRMMIKREKGGFLANSLHCHRKSAPALALTMEL